MKIRIAVVVNSAGKWAAIGWPDCGDEAMSQAAEMLGQPQLEAQYWVTAEVAVPAQTEVAGIVETP